MSRPLFKPTPRQSSILAALALVALACGFYLRYQAIEQSSVAIACESGLNSWLCSSRRVAIALFTPSVLGIVALGAAALNLLRPSLVLRAPALMAGGAGIVLYNVALSAFAVGLLIFSLARPVPERG